MISTLIVIRGAQLQDGFVPNLVALLDRCLAMLLPELLQMIFRFPNSLVSAWGGFPLQAILYWTV